ncbi:unnamed protein product [Rhizophagus irregularis]|uniref:Uncharacterized protein n=1 Tax=Rhizophagus irregularis TaxID=588596 RepID=A0A915ZQG2_9GLOM|nr:unnamed protein product [Rhizophagus irregularis]
MHFGKYDQKLIELKIEHNVGQLDADRIRAFQQKIKSPWASNLPIFVFTYLLDEGYKQLANMNETLPSKDLNSDPHIHQQPIPEEYPSKDGFENNRQLNVIARGILIHPDLVNLWKQIGYYEICNDVNDLVMQGALLILFPPTPASDWSCPSIEMVISRLVELINLGFSLKDNVIIDALRMFEHRLNEIETSCGTLSLQFDQAKQPIRNIPKDENNRQLNVIARGIFNVPDLVNLWKQIGYYEICNDVNDLVARSTSHSISTNSRFRLVLPIH